MNHYCIWTLIRGSIEKWQDIWYGNPTNPLCLVAEVICWGHTLNPIKNVCKCQPIQIGHLSIRSFFYRDSTRVGTVTFIFSFSYLFDSSGRWLQLYLLPGKKLHKAKKKNYVVRLITRPTPKKIPWTADPTLFFLWNLDLEKFSIDISLLALSLIV